MKIEYQVHMKSKHSWLLPRRDSVMNHLDNSTNGILVQLSSKEAYVDEILGTIIILLLS